MDATRITETEERDGSLFFFHFFHRENGALAFLVRSQNGSAGHAALDGLAPAIDGIESRFFVFRLSDEAGTDFAPYCFNGQTDIKGQKRPTLDFFGTKSPEVLCFVVPGDNIFF